MEATQGISVYTYPYLKLAKMLCFSFLSYMFFLQKNWRTRRQNRFCTEAGGGRGDMR
jgi:hypothetical protein